MVACRPLKRKVFLSTFLGTSFQQPRLLTTDGVKAIYDFLEKQSPPAVFADGESEHHDSLPRLGGLAGYGFVTIAKFGTCAMRKGEVLFVRLRQESSFSPPVEQRYQCAQDKYHYGHRNPEPWRSFLASDSGCSDGCIRCDDSCGRRVVRHRRFGSVGDGRGGFRRWSGGRSCRCRSFMICWHSGSVSSGCLGGYHSFRTCSRVGGNCGRSRCARSLGRCWDCCGSRDSNVRCDDGLSW